MQMSPLDASVYSPHPTTHQLPHPQLKVNQTYQDFCLKHEFKGTRKMVGLLFR